MTRPVTRANDKRSMTSNLMSAEFTVELPAGGMIEVESAEEVALWEQSARAAIEDYRLTKRGDLILLGAILTQQLAMYRAQVEMLDPKKRHSAREEVAKAAGEVRALESSLGIDKKTRESGGAHTTADYLTRLKRAGRMYGVRISERTKAHEAFANELRWKLRLLRNGDAEDRAYHGLTPESIIGWAENELAKIEEQDAVWAKEKGRLFVGQL